MITEFHFIRPFWFMLLLPSLILAWFLVRQVFAMQAWREICDAHLLAHLVQKKKHSKRGISISILFASVLFMIVSLAGPTWSRLPVPSYHQLQPRVLLLDMSHAMLAHDLSPDRLSRAKFKLHDLFQKSDAGQFGLVVYSGDSFVVSPLTEDGQTIASLLPSLTLDIMPSEGERLDSGLAQAGKLITQAGFQQGEILVLTAVPPDAAAIRQAQALARNGIHTSVLPVTVNPTQNQAFQSFATAGQGLFIPFTDTGADLNHWLRKTKNSHQFRANAQNDIPVWRDQGRWFLLPALGFMLPVFRRGWLQRIN